MWPVSTLPSAFYSHFSFPFFPLPRLNSHAAFLYMYASRDSRTQQIHPRQCKHLCLPLALFSLIRFFFLLPFSEGKRLEATRIHRSQVRSCVKCSGEQCVRCKYQLYHYLFSPPLSAHSLASQLLHVPLPALLHCQKKQSLQCVHASIQ